MSEGELLAAVREMAGWLGWRCYHTHTSRFSEAGFPDVFMVKGGRVLAVELKNRTRKPTKDQRAWLDDLTAAGVEAALWRPAAWLDGTVERVLSGQERAVWTGEG